MSDSINYSQAIDFKQTVSSAPRYNLLRVLQQTGGTSFPLSANSTNFSYFDIPAVVMNWSKSMLRGAYTILDPGVNNRFNVALTNIPPIRRMYLASRSGKYLADLQWMQHYYKMTKNLITPTEVFNSYPMIGVGSGAVGASLAPSRIAGTTLFNNPSNALNTVAPAANTLSGAKILNTGVENLAPDTRQYQTEIEFYEGGASANGELSVSFEIRFSKLAFSIFSVDRDLFFNENLQLVIEWEQTSNFCFAVPVANTLINAVPIPTAVNGADLTLYLAVEQEEAIANNIKQKVLTSGLNITIPYVNFIRQNLTASTSASVNIRLNRGLGQRLLRIISGESVNVNDTLNQRANFYNVNGVLTQNYYTTMDSVRIQAENVDCTAGYDYRYNERFLRGCPLSVQTEFSANAPVHIDDYSSVETLLEAPQKDLTICGLPLTDQDHLWGKIINKSTGMGAALDTNMNVIVVTQKTLISSPLGVDIV